MRYLGDYVEDDTVYACFNTRQADGTPITLGGTPAISVYKDGGTTESTAGVTLTTDFDSRTGLHLVAIDTSADAFYATGADYSIVITTGTVDSVSVVGTEVACFSIQNRYSTAGSGLDAAGVRAAVGLASANLDTQLATAQSDLDILTGADGAVIASGTQTFNMTGNITGNLSGSVGSVTGAVGSVTGNVGGNVTGSIGSLATQAKTDVGDAVCDEALSGHTTAGTVGKAISDVLVDTGTTIPGLIDNGTIYLPASTLASVGAAESTIQICQGDYGTTITQLVRDAGGTLVGSSLVGATLKMIIEQATTAGTDIVVYDVTGVTDGFEWTPTSTATATAGTYRWSLKQIIASPAGVKTWVRGDFEVLVAATEDA